jgi:hypothetical protein
MHASPDREVKIIKSALMYMKCYGRFSLSVVYKDIFQVYDE